VTNQVETPDTVAAVRFMSIELPELFGITDTVHAGALDALAAVLADAHVFDDLSPAHAKRVGETVAFEVIRCDWAGRRSRRGHWSLIGRSPRTSTGKPTSTTGWRSG
jgi:hypothetical protein